MHSGYSTTGSDSGCQLILEPLLKGKSWLWLSSCLASHILWQALGEAVASVRWNPPRPTVAAYSVPHPEISILEEKEGGDKADWDELDNLPG
jgi:hypothetical protein